MTRVPLTVGGPSFGRETGLEGGGSGDPVKCVDALTRGPSRLICTEECCGVLSAWWRGGVKDIARYSITEDEEIEGKREERLAMATGREPPRLFHAEL